VRDDLAAVLLLAEIGGLTYAEVSTWVDCKVTQCEEPPSWLLDASLARTPEDWLPARGRRRQDRRVTAALGGRSGA
jgi:hypothetical protein